MNKLSKDQINKIVLSGIVLVAFLYFFFTTLLGGLSATEKAANKKIADLTPKINEAKKEINECVRLEAGVPKAQDRIAEYKSLIPDGAPLAWYPPRISDFFKRHNITISSPRLQPGTTDIGVPGMARMFCVIEIPKVDVVSLGIVMAGFENEEPLSRIENLQIAAGNPDPESQRATLTISTLVKQ